MKKEFENWLSLHNFMHDDEPVKGWINETNFFNHYQDDWNELMAVVFKIESLGYWVNRINGDVWIVDNNYKPIVNNQMHQGGIEAVYLICLEFVRQYNLRQNLVLDCPICECALTHLIEDSECIRECDGCGAEWDSDDGEITLDPRDL